MERNLKNLIASGHIIAPAHITAVYKGRQFEAQILPDGGILYSGERFGSLSVAAGKAMVDAGMPPINGLNYRHANGWTFWKLVSDGHVRPMAMVRDLLKT